MDSSLSKANFPPRTAPEEPKQPVNAPRRAQILRHFYVYYEAEPPPCQA